MIDDMFVRVVRIETFAGQQLLTNASGFFYLAAGYLYLITSRHVVASGANGVFPDHLRIPVHKQRRDLTQYTTIEVPLVDGRTALWLEHPRLGADVDIVAVPINDREILRNNFVTAFQPQDLVPHDAPLPMGQQVLIVSFPLGFHDTVNHLPIVRSASIASAYSIPFKGQPYFLTDARMHRGTSGAPVIAKLIPSENQAPAMRTEWRLLGVHASALDVSDRNPALDDKLELNCAWYASLIAEILKRN